MSHERYQRQTILPQIGVAGQRRLAESRVMLAGCGAIGSVVAEQLVRAGVGFLRVVDRDVVELGNLQRQVLFDESDAAAGTPKAVAAAKRLLAINSSVTVEPRVRDIDSGNVHELAESVHLIVDGTDNAETRYLLNDFSVEQALDWVYGGCVGVEGRVMVIRPGKTPCLRCVFPSPPKPGELPTCDTAGVLGPVAAIVGSLQAIAAIRLLLGTATEESQMLVVDGWNGRLRSVSMGDRRPDCPACGRRRFE
ncbi:MAG: HesA/MoeB/ThiF family protein, partial [Tepidisphaeraceae bacterium]